MAVNKEKSENYTWAVVACVCCLFAVNIMPWISDIQEDNPKTRSSGKDKYVLDLQKWTELVRNSRVRPIIFVESSLSSTLSVRQACSVESAARWNPNLHVLLVMTSPSQENEPLVQTLRSHFGVHVLHTDPEDVFRGSPLESWYRGWSHENPHFRTVHLSDALRLALLWHLGGIYLDLDIVVQRPLDALDNAILTEADDYLCNAVMAFRPRHGFVTQCLLNFASNYSGDTWIANGPELVTRVAHGYCGVNHTQLVNDAACDMNVLPTEVGYALEWPKWQWFFQKERTPEILELTNSSLLVHLWNSQSKKWKDRVGSGSTMDLLFSRHCPVSYEHAEDGVF